MTPSQLIDKRIEDLGDWRGQTLARIRALIHKAVPEVVEEWKWEVPVWSHNGIICTGEAYKKAVKLTFPKGASLKDPAGLFNASLEGAARRVPPAMLELKMPVGSARLAPFGKVSFTAEV